MPEIHNYLDKQFPVNPNWKFHYRQIKIRTTALWIISLTYWNFPHLFPLETGGKKARDISIWNWSHDSFPSNCCKSPNLLQSMQKKTFSASNAILRLRNEIYDILFWLIIFSVTSINNWNFLHPANEICISNFKLNLNNLLNFDKKYILVQSSFTWIVSEMTFL